MSNVKNVTLQFIIDYDFGAMDINLLHDDQERTNRAEDLRSLEAMLWGMTCKPGVGLNLSWTESGSRKNERGGVTARFIGTIVGQEAFAFTAFDLLRESLEAVPHTVIEQWDVHDIEA